MTKKEETTQSFLGLAPLAQPWNTTYGLSVSSGNPITKTEERIFTELHKQEYVISAQTEKTAYAAQKAAEIRNSGADAFSEAAEHMSVLNQTARGKDFEPYVREFNHRNAQLAAENIFGVMQVGVRHIAEEVDRSLYRADDPERKPNVVQRMLGG